MIKEFIKQFKEAQRVRRYLRRQLWWKSFRNLVWTERMPLRARIRILSGFEGGLTIEDAFKWSDTLQGEGFWSENNKAFCKWYYVQCLNTIQDERNQR